MAVYEIQGIEIGFLPGNEEKWPDSASHPSPRDHVVSKELVLALASQPSFILLHPSTYPAIQYAFCTYFCYCSQSAVLLF